MKTLPYAFAILFVLFNLSVIFAQEIPPPIFPADESAQRPDLQEILKDKEFVKLYENITGQKLPSEIMPEPIVPLFSGNAAFPGMPVPSQLPLDAAMLQQVALTQLNQLDRLKSVILNDLRNAETCGYHGVKLMPQEPNVVDGQTITSSYVVQTAVLPRRYITTDRNFDLAIEGDGFFVLRKLLKPSDRARPVPNIVIPPPVYYTRAGQFELADDHKLVLKHGGETYLLLAEAEIKTPKQIVGTTNLSELRLAHFQFPERLQRVDGVIFAVVPGGEQPVLLAPNEASGSTVRTRQYEASNVNFAESLALYRTLHRMQTAMLDALTQ